MELGLPVSKLQTLERAKLLNDADDRQARLLISGYAMVSLFERVNQNRQTVQDAIAKDRLQSSRTSASKK